LKSNLFPITIASSAGGPTILSHLLSLCTADVLKYKASFFIVQHGPDWMLNSFAERLDGLLDRKVVVVRKEIPFEPCTIYIAPGDYHICFNSTSTITINDGPDENFVKPSADPLFFSVAKYFRKFATGVVLSGLGYDGTKGAKEIKRMGGTIFVQTPETAIAPSMPESIIRAELQNLTVAIDDLPKILELHITNLLEKSNQV
jgi:two-component system chemotaxis response regulator CheB